MIGKIAAARDVLGSQCLDLNDTSKSLNLVSLMIAKFARDAGRGGELRNHKGTPAWRCKADAEQGAQHAIER